MNLYRLGVKLFSEELTPVGLLEFIPVLHRWIQQRALDATLIDVADYSHVHAGPGILLVAHEGNYGIDETGGRRGLIYYRKRPLPGGLLERLISVCREALSACHRLEQETEFSGRFRFLGNEIQVIANDRLVAPNTEATFASLSPVLRELFHGLYGGAEYSLVQESDPQERFSVAARAAEPQAIATLIKRLSCQYAELSPRSIG